MIDMHTLYHQKYARMNSLKIVVLVCLLIHVKFSDANVGGTVVVTAINATNYPIPYVQIVLFGNGIKYHNSTDVTGTAIFSSLKPTDYTCLPLPRIWCYEPRLYPVKIIDNETIYLKPFHVFSC